MSQKTINDFFKTQNPKHKTSQPTKVKTNTNEYTLYFDGASRSNPGPASYGGVIYVKENTGKTKELDVYYEYIGVATNNEAEYRGALGGIQKAISLNIKNLKVFGDSKLIIEQIKGNWKCKSANLKPIHVEIKNLLHNFDTIEFAHVYRKNNKRADELANIALDNLA